MASLLPRLVALALFVTLVPRVCGEIHFSFFLFFFSFFSPPPVEPQSLLIPFSLALLPGSRRAFNLSSGLVNSLPGTDTNQSQEPGGWSDVSSADVVGSLFNQGPLALVWIQDSAWSCDELVPSRCLLPPLLLLLLLGLLHSLAMSTSNGNIDVVKRLFQIPYPLQLLGRHAAKSRLVGLEKGGVFKTAPRVRGTLSESSTPLYVALVQCNH